MSKTFTLQVEGHVITVEPRQWAASLLRVKCNDCDGLIFETHIPGPRWLETPGSIIIQQLYTVAKGIDLWRSNNMGMELEEYLRIMLETE